jgi:hypothetical protein
MFALVFRLLKAFGMPHDVVFHELKAGTHGRTRHGITYSARQQLCSGDGATSLLGNLGNVFLVMTYCLKMKLDFFLIISGDDGLTLLDREVDLTDFSAHCNSLGFTIKPKLCMHISQVSFCSKLFWPTLNGPYVLGPLPGRQLGKLGFTLKTNQGGNLKGAMISMQRDANHVPFLRLYVKRMIALLTGKAKHERRQAHTLHTTKPHEVNNETWLIVWQRYGLRQTDEDTFGAWLNTITALPHLESNKIIDVLTRIDATS